MPESLLVIMARRSWTCAVCGSERHPGQMLRMEDVGPVCLACSDLNHLEFLPSGNIALTRRSTRASRLTAVVVRWSSARKRYERQGILAEPAAIEQAEAECLDDAEARARQRARAAERRQGTDERFVAELAAAVQAQFPGCPAGRAERIARHAGERSSGRIGRTRAGRKLDPEAVRLAVIAAVRHEDTDYERLLGSGVPRMDAREQVRRDVDRILTGWAAG